MEPVLTIVSVLIISRFSDLFSIIKSNQAMRCYATVTNHFLNLRDVAQLFFSYVGKTNIIAISGPSALLNSSSSTDSKVQAYSM